MDKLLDDILNTVAPSGYEVELQKVIKSYTSKFAVTTTDSAHNLYSVINDNNKFKILMAAHSDEIGLIITKINGNGTCSVRQVGGIKPALYVGALVHILHNGKLIDGVMGIKNNALNSKVDVNHLFLDLGVDSYKEASELVSIGDEIVLNTKTVLLNDNRLVSRALDDKIGCYVITKALEELSKRSLETQVCSCTTTREELGTQGAFFAAVNFNPNIAIAVDVTYTSDVDGDASNYGEVSLGRGPAICHSGIIHKKLNSLLTSVSTKNNIPVQYEVMPRGTGTDADKIHFTNKGVSVCLVSIPLRYMHSGVEIVDMRDVENAIKLLVEFISELNSNIDLCDLSYTI